MRTVTLKEYGLCLYNDRGAFALGDLEISVNNIPARSGEFLFFAFSDGKQIMRQTVTPEKNRVTVSAKLLSAGKFNAYVSHFVNGIEAKRYPIEPLLVTDVHGSLSAAPEIAALTAEIAALKEEASAAKAWRTEAAARLAALQNTVAELETRLSVVEKNIDIFEN